MSARAVSLTAASTLAIMAAAASGCAASPRHKEPAGVVAGFAVPCAGAAVAAQLQVRVSSSEHGHTVATVVARYQRDRGHYRLILPPGRYLISARGSSEPPRPVILHPGEHVTVNFPDHCKQAAHELRRMARVTKATHLQNPGSVKTQASSPIRKASHASRAAH